MIKQIPMQTIICDNCGTDWCKDGDYAGWSLDSPVEEMADDDGWLCEDGKHYCPDCYSYNDNDELTLKLIEAEEE